MAHNIALSLRQNAAKKGSAIGLIEAKTSREVSFERLESLSDSYAWYLKENHVNPGDRVMLMVKPSVEFICLSFALFKLGAPVILIDPGMGYKNLLRCISHVKPKVFIGIPLAHLFIRVFEKSFNTLTKKFCCGKSFGIFGPDITQKAQSDSRKFPVYSPDENDLAAIIFTTGSTGPPKGVRYEHSIFAAQLQHIQEYYMIGSDDIDQPAFPLFALFSTALGACAVIPDMDATKPAEVNPAKYIDSLRSRKVTYSFGSPALWNVVSNYCLESGIQLKSLEKVLMAGAPVSGELIQKVSRILSADAKIHTPYGATESLPVVSIEGKEIIEETWQSSIEGKGTCVGRPLPGIRLEIIALSDTELPVIKREMILGPGEIGEIIVSGNVVTQAYDNNERETRLAKTYYDNALWHRMGDVGYLDYQGRLWFCGRKSHRVPTKNGTKFTIQCEAIINNHPDIFRSALVGVFGDDQIKIPVIILELLKKSKRSKVQILREVKTLAASSELTCDVEHFFFHKKFPVDIRHNAKIFREKLAIWAEQKMST